ncbi:MAG: hypothetical protein FWC01_08820 [Treponema sp.]|nr:hypothetical protein [Treponema sp.]MCL2238068.1 hypothetical protein [Treponema sp.]
MKNRVMLALLIAFAAVCFSACLILPFGSNTNSSRGPSRGGGGGGVSISPSSVTVQTNRTVQFNARVSDSRNNNVTWRINGAQSSRTNINSNGLLTVAPNESARSITVVAASVSDPSKTGRANVTIRNNDNNNNNNNNNNRQDRNRNRGPNNRENDRDRNRHR